MIRRSVWVAVYVLVVSSAALAVLPNRSAAQPPRPRPGQGNQIPAEAPPPVTTMLEMTIDMKDFQIEMSLKEFLGLVYEKLNATGMELPIVVDRAAFTAQDPNAPDVYETRIKFQQLPRKMTISDALRIALKEVHGGHATFVVKRDGIEVTTAKAASLENTLQKRIAAGYKNRRLSEVLQDLADLTGATILIDKRAAADANRPITVTFRGDASLAGALRVLTEMVDLKIVVLEGILYVTTPAHADVLRKEKLQRQNHQDPLWPNLPPSRPRQWPSPPRRAELTCGPSSMVPQLVPVLHQVNPGHDVHDLAIVNRQHARVAR
jgi:hypothetical protein